MQKISSNCKSSANRNSPLSVNYKKMLRFSDSPNRKNKYLCHLKFEDIYGVCPYEK